MRQEFELTLCNYTRYAWLGWVGLMAAFGLTAGVCIKIVPHSWGFAGAMLVLVPCLYGVFQLLKRLTLRPALIAVVPTGLLVRYLTTGEEIAIAFADIAAYRDEQLKDGRELRFRLHSGKKMKLATNHFLGPTGDYEALLQAVQAAFMNYNATAPATISRDKSFFEKPFATLLLAFYTLVLAVGVGTMLLRHRPVTGSLFTALGLLLTYAGMWYNARARRPS